MLSPAGHAAPFEATERRLAPLLDRVPITRVYDATRLDCLGVPVWGAVTPLAADLKVHAGKGATAAAARISAVMEAIERVSAEEVAPERVLRAPRRAMDATPTLDPASCDLPFETCYRPETVISWVQGVDLASGRAVWVALDLVLSPAREGVCLGVETNGLAAGNTLTEAILHALLELIERDAHAQRRFAVRYAEPTSLVPARMLDPDIAPAPAGPLLAHLRGRGLRVRVQELTNDIAVPVFRVLLGDPSFPGGEGTLRWFEGLGCDLDPVAALLRAATEAAQSHTAVLLGARDTFEGGPAAVQPGAEGLVRRLLAREERIEFPPRPAPPADLVARLRIVLGRLAAAGIARCVAVELTRVDLGIPVVRVLAPGLAGPWGESSRRPGRRLLELLG